LVLGNSRGFISLWNHKEALEDVWTDAEIEQIRTSKKIHDNSITVLQYNRESIFYFFKFMNKSPIFGLY
jgi:hypothetical protein